MSLETQEGQRQRYNYKPVVLRTLPLLCLFLFTLALIGLLQFAAMQLPHGETRLDAVFGFGNQKRELRVLPRQDGNENGESQTSSATAQNNAIGTTTTSSAKASPSPSAASSSSDSPSASPASSNYLEPERTTIIEVTTQKSAYVSPTETVSVTSAVSSSNYLNPERTTTLDEITVLATRESAYATPKETVTIPSSAPVSQYLESATVTIPPIVASTNDDAYVPTKETKTLPVISTFTVVTTSQSAVVVPITRTQESQSETSVRLTAPTAYLTTTDLTLGPSDVPLTEIAFSTAYVPVVVTMTITSSSGGLQNARPTAGSGFDGANGESVGHGKPTVLVFGFDQSEVFISTYLAVLLAVIYRILLNVVHNNLTLIEPFRQLNEPNGALAENALFSFYHRQAGLLGPIPALRKRRWALACVGTAYLASCLLPALASEAIWADTNWQCPFELRKPDDSNNPCAARMTASITVIRILQGLLGFSAVIILGLASLLLLRKTGLPADPSSIATVSSMIRHPGLQEDIQALPTGAGSTLEIMRSAISGKRYCLGDWSGPNGRNYGIRPIADVDSGADSDRSSSIYSKTISGYAPVDSRSSFNEADMIAHRWRWMDFTLLIFIVGTFGVVLAYYLDGGDDGFNRFFSSNTFGPRFILTAAGTVTASMWNTVEKSSVVMAPFIRLARGPAFPTNTLAFAPSNTPVLATWCTLRSRYWFIAVISVTTLLGEALNIVISGVPYATAQTWQQFLISAYLSIAILATMILVSAGVIYHRRHEPRIPVHPDTLGTKMSYLAGARMLDDLEGSEQEKANARSERLRLPRRKYEFRASVRQDGRRTWLVDEAHDQRGSYQSI